MTEIQIFHGLFELHHVANHSLLFQDKVSVWFGLFSHFIGITEVLEIVILVFEVNIYLHLKITGSSNLLIVTVEVLVCLFMCISSYFIFNFQNKKYFLCFKHDYLFWF